MIRIAEANQNEHLLGEACNVLHLSHEAELKTTGLYIDTSSLSVMELSSRLEQENGTCLVAIDESEVLGTLSVFTDPNCHWYLKEGDSSCIIKYVAVRPDQQGKGIATRLLDEVKKINKCDVITVSTDERNKHAIRLYEKNEFIPVSISRARKAKSNAVKMAFWANGCPLEKNAIERHLLVSKAKCSIKRLLQY